MEKYGPFIINEWLRLIELYIVEYPRNSRGSQSIVFLYFKYTEKKGVLTSMNSVWKTYNLTIASQNIDPKIVINRKNYS